VEAYSTIKEEEELIIYLEDDLENEYYTVDHNSRA